MAALVTIAIVGTIASIAFGAYLKVCSAIRREDRKKWSLRRSAPNQSARSARSLVGMSSFGWK